MNNKINSVLFYSVVTILFIYILVEVFAPSKTLDYFGFKPYVVVSNSMEPDINVNDVVIVRDVLEESLNERDVISFEVYLPELEKRGVVTHYIGEIEIKEDGTRIYHTQGATKAEGDYDQWTDEFGNEIDLTYKDLSGKVIFIIPYLGYLIQLLRDVKMVFLLFINAMTIYAIIKIVRSPKKEVVGASFETK